MKLVRQIQLFLQEDRSDKAYEIDLCEVGAGEFVVNFRFGRRGTALRDGTKTVLPVDLARAEKIFDSLVAEKRGKGYREAGEAAAGPRGATRRSTPAAARPAFDVDARLLERLAAPPNDNRLDRTIWRLGERRAPGAARAIERFADAKTPRRRYVVAWALGRCGDSLSRSVLERLSQDRDPAVARAGRFALKGLDASALQAAVLESLPLELRLAVREGRAAEARHALGALDDAAGAATVEKLYEIESLPVARVLVLEWARTARFEPPFFRTIRHLFKAAEHALDTELFGLLAYRFEKEKKRFNHRYDSLPLGGRWIQIAKEIKESTSRVAYGAGTRDYLRRRAARTLRRLAALGDPLYVPLAVATLLPFSDADGQEPFRRERYDWENERRTYVFGDRFTSYLALCQILYGQSPRYKPSNGRAWICQPNYRPGKPAPVVREEAFPQLWDARPDALLELLLASRCAPVHEFAAKAIKGQLDFLAALELDQLGGLLAQPYDVTSTLALELARKRFDPARPDPALVGLVLSAALPEARAQGLAWLDSSPELLDDPDLILTMMTSAHPEVRQALVAFLSARPSRGIDRQALATRWIERLLALEAGQEELAQEMALVGLRLLPQELANLPVDLLRALLCHPLVALQSLCGRILVELAPPERVTADLFSGLLGAEAAPVRAWGIRLLARLSPDELAAREEFILATCLAPETEIRQAARKLLEQVAGARPDVAKSLCHALTMRLFRPDKPEGLHADLGEMLQVELKAHLDGLGAPLALRLLRNQEAGAQRVGSALVAGHVPGDKISVRDWAKLAHHEMADVRALAWTRLEADPRVIKELGEAIRAVDGPWAESRARGFKFFRTFGAADWDPALLIALCDSVEPEAQAFGRELLTRFFDDDAGPLYLERLAQHPSVDVQLFATNYLQRFAAGRPERVIGLRAYFAAVFARINQGRVAKDRCLDFLLKEAVAERRVAEMALPLLEQVAASVGLADRGPAIAALRDIVRAHPDLQSLLKVRAVARRAA